MFDAPQKSSICKPVESNNCSKVKEDLKPEDKSVKKSVESNVQTASQIIEDESSPMIDLSECDVSCLVLLSCLIICIKVCLHIKYISAIHCKF